MPVPVIPALPPAPSRADSGSVFAEKADAHVAALAGWTAKANDLGAYINAAGEQVATDAAAVAAQTDAVQSAAAQASAAAAAAQAAAGLPPTAQFGQVIHTEGQTNIINASVQLQTGRAYECDTSAAAFSVPLPLNPNVGDFVWLNDHLGTFAKNNLTVLRNGKKIQGKSEDYIMDLNYLNNQLTYISASHGWAIK
ncbi:hypothetical protein HQN60_12655 [Deefgea piscis]|uniref:Uncharacterized protein n=1 Tax=Deefgea piscis TaxID=2739061 RepID=A0A6M8STT6_9NEIS|nr:hypothetical protein [Deefgea piscis]QKJ67488.1 hypothetical protein HQN60_12655 [Deefgea piscis]